MDGDSTLGDEATVAPAPVERVPVEPVGTRWMGAAAAADDSPSAPDVDPDRDSLDPTTDPTTDHTTDHTTDPSPALAEAPPPATGDPTVDQATAEVAATFGEPLETRLAAYERAHRTLQDRLADVEG